MEKEFVNYDQGLELKHLGFDEDCFASFFIPNLYSIKFTATTKRNSTLAMGGLGCTAPLKQQVLRWFREKYNLWSYVYPYIHDKDWHFHIQFYNSEMWGEIHLGNKFNTYEEAENDCIDKLIEIAKQQDK